MATWQPSSWRSFPAAQQPDWPSRELADEVVEEVLRDPPAEVLTDEEVVEIVHRVRARRG